MNAKLGSLFITSVLLLSTSLVHAGTANITESEYGEKWPLTVAGGALSCKPVGSLGIVTFTANGKTYAVNGTAMGQAKKNGWKEIDEIWKPNPTIPGTKIDMEPILDKGLSLCK